MNKDLIPDAATVANKVMYAGAAGAGAGSFLLDNFVAIIALAIAFGGFFLNWYYKYQTLKLLRASCARASKAELEAMASTVLPTKKKD